MARPKVDDPMVPLTISLRRSVVEEIERRAIEKGLSKTIYLRDRITSTFAPKPVEQNPSSEPIAPTQITSAEVSTYFKKD